MNGSFYSLLIFLLVAMLMTLIPETIALPLNVPSDFLSLGLTSDSSHQQHEALDSNNVNSESMKKILADDITGEFPFTEAAFQHIESTLNEFAQREQLNQDAVNSGKPITWWLGQQTGAGSVEQLMSNNQIKSIETQINELDLLSGEFGRNIKSLIQKIIMERPSNLGNMDLDYRCKKVAELGTLKQQSTHSSAYQILIDTFAIELYNHCLVRKLAMIKLSRTEPSSTVRQIVDIYLNLPDTRSIDRDAQLASSALGFNLQNAISTHGPLETAASLVFDGKSLGFSLNSNSNDTKDIVHRFKLECQHHIEELGKIWTNFDDIPKLLTSQMINLLDYSSRIKLAAPQLVYGSICSQLATTV